MSTLTTLGLDLLEEIYGFPFRGVERLGRRRLAELGVRDR